MATQLCQKCKQAIPVAFAITTKKVNAPRRLIQIKLRNLVTHRQKTSQHTFRKLTRGREPKPEYFNNNQGGSPRMQSEDLVNLAANGRIMRYRGNFPTKRKYLILFFRILFFR
jgi:hypothetical protein